MGAYLMLGGSTKEPKIVGSISEGEHAKWIPINSWSFSAMRPIVSGGGASQTKQMGEAQLSEISISKPVDVSSTYILQTLLNGESLDKMQIDMTSSDNSSAEKPGRTYFTIKGTVVRITNLSTSGSGDEGSVAYESFNLNCSALSWRFVPYDEANKPGTPVSIGFNLDKVVTLNEDLFK